ncbi:hypothetical protein HZH66_001617 [Vespula vulgaris]|uniref:Uncharacterized protein n=1 Tax=Vespula vulgaris TaxID=7454 RepID=A0A834KVG7_VESVU|nr:hypothetical protein HZH66_001617 [Vespula vulgaris]
MKGKVDACDKEEEQTARENSGRGTTYFSFGENLEGKGNGKIIRSEYSKVSRRYTQWVAWRPNRKATTATTPTAAINGCFQEPPSFGFHFFSRISSKPLLINRRKSKITNRLSAGTWETTFFERKKNSRCISRNFIVEIVLFASEDKCGLLRNGTISEGKVDKGDGRS